MRNFLLGVVVGATGMGFYTGHIKIVTADGKPFQPMGQSPENSSKVEGSSGVFTTPTPPESAA